MSCTTVTTQAGLDAALANDAVTCVHIDADAAIRIELTSPSKPVEIRGSSSVEARDSSRVVAWDSSSVVARDSSSVVAWDSSRVEAWDSSRVVARDSSSVEARDSSSVVAWDSSRVEAWDSSSVVARDSSRVEAWDSSSVVARDSSRVVAWDSSSVEARGSSSVEARDSSRVEAWDSSRVVAWDSSRVEARGAAGVHARHRSTVKAGGQCAVWLHSGQATVQGGQLIDLTQLDLDDPQVWVEHHGVQVEDDSAVLYKALRDDLTSGRDRDRPTVWAVGADVACADWRDDHDCGGGLHLSPTPSAAKRYDDGATRFLRCKVPVADVRPINGSHAPKCKVPTAFVVAEVDIHGEVLPLPKEEPSGTL